LEQTLLTPEQVAEKLAISPKTVKDWLREGRLKGIKIGRLWRIKPEDLQAFIQTAEEDQSGSE
jgi:excisionase family DNA binding protein